MLLSGIFHTGEGIFWILCFSVALILFIAGIAYLIIQRKVRGEDLAKATVFEFIAAVILFLPGELFDNGTLRVIPVLKGTESLLTSILRTINMYMGNDYSEVALEGHPVFSTAYAALMTATNIALLVFAFGFLIKFLDGPLQKLRLLLRGKRNTYLFTDINEKTMTIAGSVPDKNRSLVFCSQGTELTPEQRERIEEMGGIYVNDPPEILIRKAQKKGEKLEIFLFGDSEDSNLSKLSVLCAVFESLTPKKVRIYVELSQTPWDLYDHFLERNNAEFGDNLIINFVRTEENFAYNHLLKHSIFEGAIPQKAENGEEPARKIGVLIAGMNQRNLELFKAILHLSQMPGYRLSILVLDADPFGWEHMLQMIPEIHKSTEFSDALYDLHYFEGVDFATDKPEQAAEMYLPDFTFAFVNAEDDLMNLNLALRLQTFRYRRGQLEGYRIQVNITDRKLCTHWNTELLKNLTIVGDTASTYDYGFVTMSDIERASVAIHYVRYPKNTPEEDAAGKKPNKTWTQYCNDEYNRHSVYARTLSFKYKVAIIDEFYGSDYSITSTDRTWKIYEHMRWDVYTRTLGYVLTEQPLKDAVGKPERPLRDLAKAHSDLVPYEELDEETKSKDALKLTPEIVAILKSI
jgi:hypothetical protein